MTHLYQIAFTDLDCIDFTRHCSINEARCKAVREGLAAYKETQTGPNEKTRTLIVDHRPTEDDAPNEYTVRI